ncbi:serine/threonine specific protein phosphatase, partial [Cardiosporidium cionae]
PPSTESLLLPPPPPPCVSYEEFTPVCSGDLLTSNTERAQTRSDKKFSITGLLPEEERMPQEAATHHLILKWESLDAGYVEMAGTFSNPPWQKHFPLKFCPDLCCHWIDIHEATSSDFPDISGRHQFKYIVDGQWMCNPSLLICDDGNHNLNNVVVIVPEALMRQTARRYRPTPAQRVGATVRPVRSNETASSGYLLPSAYREDVGKLGAAVCTPLEYTCNSASLSSVVLPSLSSPTLVKDVIASSTTHRNVKNRIRRSPCIESRSCKPLPDSKDKTEQAGSVRIKTTELEENVDLNAFNASSSFAEQVPFPLYLPAAAANKSGTMKRCAAVQDLCRNAPKELQVKEDSLFTQNGMQSKTLSTLVDISLDLHPGNGSLYSTFTPSPLHRKDHAAEIIPSLWNAAFSQNSDENAGESMAFLPPPLSSSPVAFLPPSPPSSSAPSFARNEQHPSTAPPYGLVAQYPPQETFVEAPSLTVAYPVFESTKGGASSCGEEGDNLFKIHSASTAHKPQILMDISSIEPSQKEFQSLPAPTPYPVASSSHQRRTVPATRYGSSIPTLNRCNSAYANGRTFDILRDNLRRVSSMTAGSWPAAVTELLHRPESLLNLDVPENIRGTTGLTLHYGGNMIPHPEKLNDGADAYFSTPIEGKNSGEVKPMFEKIEVFDLLCYCVDSTVCVGVADGVGEWESIGLNPRLFAEELMQGCSEAFLNYNGDESAIEEKAMNILQRGYDSTRSFGSSTALIVCLDEKGERIGVSNLGDSTMILLHPQRSDNMSCVYRTKEQQHQFNCPYQLSRLPKPEDYEALKAEGKDLLVRVLQKSTMLPQDTPVMASSCELKVTEGDLIILGTDGVFDNLYDFEICDLANLALSPFEGLLVQRPDMITSPRTLATAIAEAASYRSKDMAAKTPFMKHARECGTNYIGGKLDDITVVACWVTRK